MTIKQLANTLGIEPIEVEFCLVKLQADLGDSDEIPVGGYELAVAKMAIQRRDKWVGELAAKWQRAEDTPEWYA